MRRFDSDPRLQPFVGICFRSQWTDVVVPNEGPQRRQCRRIAVRRLDDAKKPASRFPELRETRGGRQSKYHLLVVTSAERGRSLLS
jgi:hypothetical protein